MTNEKCKLKNEKCGGEVETRSGGGAEGRGGLGRSRGGGETLSGFWRIRWLGFPGCAARPWALELNGVAVDRRFE